MGKWEAFAIGISMTALATLLYEHGMWWMCLIAAPIMVWSFVRDTVEAIAAWKEYRNTRNRG